MPSFGEENARGFYLRDAGMYFVLGDYFDMSLTGDYYTLGSWAANLNSRYMVKYKFTGNLAVNYSVDQTGEKGSTDFFQSKNFGVRWSHSQDSKAHPGTSFSASVNFSSRFQQPIQLAFGVGGSPEPDLVFHLILKELERKVQPVGQRPAQPELKGQLIHIHTA